MKRRYCPVCWQTVHRSRHDNIQDHWDSEGVDTCPMSGESYDLAGWGRRRLFRVTEKDTAA